MRISDANLLVDEIKIQHIRAIIAMKYFKIASFVATLFLSTGCGSLYYSDRGYVVHHYSTNSMESYYAPMNSTYYRLGVCHLGGGHRPLIGGFRGGFHSHHGHR